MKEFPTGLFTYNNMVQLPLEESFDGKSITNYIPVLKVLSYGCFTNSNYVSTMSDPPNHDDQDHLSR